MSTLETEGREFIEPTQALSVDALLQSVGYMEAEVERPDDTLDRLTDSALATGVAMVQDALSRLRLVERDLAVALGKRLGKTTGYLADGRQFTLDRSTDRKEWQHDDWKRDVRRAVTDMVAPADAGLVVVNPETGEETSLRQIIQVALDKAQNVHGSQAPKSTALKGLGLYASDYCTSTPGGWRFHAIPLDPPTTTENSSGEQNDG